MDFQSMWAMLSLAIGSTMPLILLLIGLDLVLGIFCAIKRGAFEWGKVGQFYQTMVVPYVGGYLALQIAFTLLPEQLGTVLAPTLTGLHSLQFLQHWPLASWRISRRLALPPHLDHFYCRRPPWLISLIPV